MESGSRDQFRDRASVDSKMLPSLRSLLGVGDFGPKSKQCCELVEDCIFGSKSVLVFQVIFYDTMNMLNFLSSQIDLQQISILLIKYRLFAYNVFTLNVLGYEINS